MTNHRPPLEDEVQIDRITIDLPDGDDPALAGEIAAQVRKRLQELLEEF